MPPEIRILNQTTDPARSSEPVWRAVFSDGTERPFGDGTPSFTVRVPTEIDLNRLLATDVYSAAIAFIRGEFDVEGDLAAAIRFRGWQPRSGLRRHLLSAIARCAAALEGASLSKAKARREIRFHYDRSNEFYSLFLDSRMVYSCAYFRSPETTLEDAQVAKLDLKPEDRFLDVGCGWGALIEHATAEYGAEATGCTLSQAQHAYAVARLDGRARVLECDYRDLAGSFDKIASVGMFEHVGRRGAAHYFRKIADLLAPDGLFLNHAITRPASVTAGAPNLFIARKVFPGTQLLRLDQVIRAAETAGFEVLDVENLHRHYARTSSLWLGRLTANRQQCLKLVDEVTWRTWRLYLAGCSVHFEQGELGLHQVLFAKRGARPLAHLTRDYIYD